MTATARSYRPRFYTEVLKEVGSPDDCTICSGLTLYDAATLGEGVTRNDGSLFDTIRLRELRDEAGLAPDGSAKLNDLAKYLRFISEKAGLDPHFELDYYPGHPPGTLRLTWQQFRAKISDGHIGVLLGSPIAVKDSNSPLRTVQDFDGFKHAVAVMAGDANGALLFDPLNKKPPTFPGVKCSWIDLKQYTEAVDKDGDRLFGTPEAIGCAIAKIGSETMAAREARKAGLKLAKAQANVASLKVKADQALQARDVAVGERDQALQARDVAVGERDQALQARDVAVGERDQALQARDVAVGERDQALQARDVAVGERDQALQARDVAVGELQVARQQTAELELKLAH